MTKKFEEFYRLVYNELASRLGVYKYKGIDVVPLEIQFYLNTIINSELFISRMARVEADQQMQVLKEHYFETYFRPKGNTLKLITSDIARYFYHRLNHKSQPSDADYFVLITNKKFFSFVEPVKKALEQSAKKVEFLLWDKNDSVKNQTKMHLPKTSFPDFSNNQYTQYHQFTSLIDRASGFLPLLKNKKLIIIEGDLEAQHILGLLGKENQFETYCLQWGFFGKTATKTGWRDMPYDKLLVWGDFFAENFKRYNPKTNVVATGHPTLKENTITEKGKTILFAVQKQFGEHITTQDVVDFIHFAAKTATQMPDYKIIIRSHPDFEIPENIRQEFDSVSNIIWHDYKNFSLNQSFEQAQYCVSISSTVSLEAVAFGCYPVYLKINQLPLQIHELLDNKEYEHVFESENFVDGIRNLENQNLKTYLADFKNRLYKNLGTAAVAAIVSEINT